nr:MAG TPA: hypothetical protein [Caudoviricetes sp.]
MHYFVYFYHCISALYLVLYSHKNNIKPLKILTNDKCRSLSN